MKNNLTKLQEDQEDIVTSFLKDIQSQGKEVNIYLVNGIRLRGFIYKYDQNSILLRNGGIQLIRMNAISTIMPGSHAGSNVATEEQRRL